MLDVERHADHDGVVLRLRGELDLATASVLEAEVRAALATDGVGVVLDLDGLAFADSTGLAAVARLSLAAAADGRRIVVRNPSPCARSVLAITGLDADVTILPDEGGAPPADGGQPPEHASGGSWSG